MSGIEIKIDNLGRLVIPIKYRKKLGIVAEDKLLISLSDSSLVISPITKNCVLCGEKLSEKAEIKLCDICISMVKKINND